MAEYMLNEDMNRIYERLVERAENKDNVKQSIVDGGIHAIEVNGSNTGFTIYDCLDSDVFEDLYLFVYTHMDAGEHLRENKIMSLSKEYNF